LWLLGALTATNSTTAKSVRDPNQGSSREKEADFVVRWHSGEAQQLNERHLKRLMNEYVSYYHSDRTHLGSNKQAPAGRKQSTGKTANMKVISKSRLGGLHHLYDLAA